MGSKHLMGDINLSWPSAEIAVMGADGAVEIIFKKYREDTQKVAELIEEYKSKFSNPNKAASQMFIDDLIEPKNTRANIADFVISLKNKKIAKYYKKHDNLPL